MTAGAPRSARGLDPKAREAAESLARQAGLSLEEWLSQIAADEGPEDATSQDYFNTHAQSAYLETPRQMTTGPARYEIPEHPADEVGRVTQALDRLSARIEAAERRSTTAINGVDETVRAVVQRLETAEREQVAVAARFEGAVQDGRQEQTRIAERLRRIEQEAHGPRSADALRSLETALGKIAGHLYEGEGRTQAALAEVRSRVDRLEVDPVDPVDPIDPADLVDAVVSRLGERLEAAEQNTSGALRGLQTSFAALDDRLRSVESPGSAGVEARLEQLATTLAGRVDAARAEMAERMRVTADTRFDRMDRALAEMTEHVRTAESRSAQALERMGREVVEMAETFGRRVQSVEHRNADAIEQVGGEVARIAQAMESKLGRADTVQAQALEKLGLEIARITERLTERIANSERRSAQAIDDVGEQMARITERISQRHERSSSDLADRIHQSEERTARLLEEAREKLERLTESRRAIETARAAYDPDEALFAEDPFPQFQPPPPAATAFADAQPPAAAAFAPSPLRPPTASFSPEGALFAAPAAHAPSEAAPVTALRPRMFEAQPFSQQDFEAASVFTVGNLALDTRQDEALFADDEALEVAPPEPLDLDAAAEPQADDLPVDEVAIANDGANDKADLAGPDEKPHFEPELEPDWPADILLQTEATNVAAFVEAPPSPEPPADAEAALYELSAPAPAEAAHAPQDSFVLPPSPEAFRLPEEDAAPLLAPMPAGPLTTRDVVERARAATRASAVELAPRRKSPADAPPSSSMFGRSFGKADHQRSFSPWAVSGIAAVTLGLVGGYILVSGGLGAGLSSRFKHGVELARARPGELRTPEADTTPHRAGDAPQMAVALAIKPLDAPQTPTAAAAAGAKPTEDLAAAYSAAVAKVETRDKHGIDDLRRIANLGYGPAQFYLAKQYEDGTGGVKKDVTEARRWYERAAESGERKAMHNLAMLYYSGAGGPRNSTTAAQWFRRAADLGLVDSQYNLGQLYEQGLGVSLNPAEAYKWYLIAARSGDAESKASAQRVRGLLSLDARTTAERAVTAFRSGAPAAPALASAAPPSPNGDLVTAQRALSSLGYYQGPSDGVASPALRLAIAQYQREQGLPATGAADPITIGKLATITR